MPTNIDNTIVRRTFCSARRQNNLKNAREDVIGHKHVDEFRGMMEVMINSGILSDVPGFAYQNLFKIKD